MTFTPYLLITVVEVAAIAVLLPKASNSVLITVMLLQIIFHLTTAAMLYRHQKVLEWFQSHIRLETNRLPDGAPKDMGRKDGKEV